MVRTLVTGGTGTLGSALRPRLLEAGHDVRASSRSPPADGDVEWVEMDLVDGSGIEDAVADVDVIVHTATAPQGDTAAVDVEGTKRLLAAAVDAGVENVVYVSIVGVDEIPFSYYEHKLAAEQVVEEGDVPWTIVRVTQFHSFVADLLRSLRWLPVWPLPTELRSQPIAVAEAADTIVDHATPEAGGRVPEIGGPDVLTLGEMARFYRQARGLRRLQVRLPLPGDVASDFRAGKATNPERNVGTTAWAEWLAARYGPDAATDRESSASPS